MIEYVITFILIASAIIFFILKSGSKPNITIEEKEEKKIEMTPMIKKEEPTNNKESLLNSFKEVKELRNPKVYSNGKVLLFSDEKRIVFGYINNLKEKNPKFFSKSVEQDIISDISYSEDKGLIAVGLKNSKEILFYSIAEEAGKKKLEKSNNKIKTMRKYEIKNVSISKDGNYVSSSGTGQDTEVQIYNVGKGNMIEKLDTGGIQNLEMKMTPDDRYLTISTYMYEIALVEFKKTFKFNKEINGDEVFLKIQRNKSVSGIKIPITSYDFSNDSRFFIVACENKKIKIFQNFGNFEESKVFHEFDINEEGFQHGECVSLFVTNLYSGKLQGHVAVSQGSDIFLYTTEGKCERRLRNSHDSQIVLLKLVETAEEVLLLSGSRDGRFNVWKVL